MSRLLAILPAFLLTAATPPTASVDIHLINLRSARGLIHVCLTRNRAFFPDCRKDPKGLRQSAPANERQLHFNGVVPGRYAVTVAHDENSNQKLDTTLGIPREGFGFSRNPKIRFGAPKFDEVSIQLGPASTSLDVRMQYLL